MTAAIVILADPHFGDPMTSAWHRVLEIGIGAVVAMVTSLTIFPARAGAALSAHLGRALPLFAELLRRTIDGALGGEFEEGTLLASSASIRGALSTGDALAAEARRELAGHLAEHADPAALMRTLRRLYHTEVMLARAARGGLYPVAAEILRPALEHLRETATAAMLELARACAAGTELPPTLTMDPHLAALDAAVERLRQAGVARAMTTADVGRLFALTFALRQLGENLRDLAERCHDLRP